jgi:Protein involved in formate dehydrogenase formation
VTTTRGDELRQLARMKISEIQAIQPDLADALELQSTILRLLIDASERLQDSGEAPALQPAAVIEKWSRGITAFRGESFPLPSSAKEDVLRICGALATGEATDSAHHIHGAVAEGEIDAGSLISVSLARNQKAIRTSAIHMGMAPDLLWLIGELASAPLAHRLQAQLFTSPAIQAAATAWDAGHCPCCGSWPALIEVLQDQTRVLRCSYCTASWSLRNSRCIYCNNRDQRFVSAAPDMERPDRRLDLCAACGSYTKVTEVDALTPFPLVAIADLGTMDLDEGAMSRGYGRPPLVDLDEVDLSRRE